MNPCAEAFRQIANWLDHLDTIRGVEGQDEMQQDIRRWAREFEEGTMGIWTKTKEAAVLDW